MTTVLKARLEAERIRLHELDAGEDPLIVTPNRRTAYTIGDAAARIEELEKILDTLTAKGINVQVLCDAYGWTFDVDGEIHGLTAGDMGYEATGIKIEHLVTMIKDENALKSELTEAKRIVRELRKENTQLKAALTRLADRVEQIELPDGSTPDTLEARMLTAVPAFDADGEPIQYPLPAGTTRPHSGPERR